MTEPIDLGGAVPAEPALASRRARREMRDAPTDVTEPRPLRRTTPGTLAVAGAFAVLFAWDLVEAIAALVALLGFAAAAGHPLNSYAWLVLGTGILVPPLALTIALIVGWGRGPLRMAGVLMVGLATSAALGLTVEALLRG